MSLPLSSSQKSLILRVINCFETGSPEGDYGALVVYADGPHGMRQITYGRSQVTEYGNLRELIGLYVAAKGELGGALSGYLDDVGSVPLTDNKAFKSLLRSAGQKDPVMWKIQDKFFDDAYFKPALKWAEREGFTLPLSMLVIYDSFIHSGSILWLIRRKFKECTPRGKGKEKEWIAAYVKARHEWLSKHKRRAVKLSSYRTRDLLKMIEDKNWNLDKLPLIANGIEVYPA
jgi:chitosanase